MKMFNKKKKYFAPAAEIDEFTFIDVITNSMDNGDDIPDPFANAGKDSVGTKDSEF